MITTGCFYGPASGSPGGVGQPFMVGTPLFLCGWRPPRSLFEERVRRGQAPRRRTQFSATARHSCRSSPAVRGHRARDGHVASRVPAEDALDPPRATGHGVPLLDEDPDSVGAHARSIVPGEVDRGRRPERGPGGDRVKRPRLGRGDVTSEWWPRCRTAPPGQRRWLDGGGGSTTGRRDPRPVQGA